MSSKTNEIDRMAREIMGTKSSRERKKDGDMSVEEMASSIIGKSGAHDHADNDEVSADEHDVGDFDSMSIERGAHGFDITTTKEFNPGGAATEEHTTKHSFGHDHAVAKHIRGIHAHTKKKH